jgi:hypothetical protein
MQRKHDRAIAVLEVEAKMLEAHAEKLSIMARQLAHPEHQREIIKLSHEETTVGSKREASPPHISAPIR